MNLTPFRAAAMALLISGTMMSATGIAQDTTEEQVTPRSADEIYSDLRLFGEVFDRIRAEYVEIPDEKELIRAAIQGMLSSLDPHSGYLDPVSYEDVREDTSGKFGGLGIEVTMEEGVIKVVSPIDETPAAKAGILSNDLIVALDGKQVFGMTLDEAIDIMKGEVGTKIDLSVVREGADDLLEFTLTRDIIALRAVRWYIERDVGVMRLSRFSEQAYTGIEKAVRDIFDERDGVSPKGLILDLRNNPGGLVDQAVFVSDAFLGRGSVVLTRGRLEEESARYDAQADDLDRSIADIPLIVLINGGSASAAEIVAGALQDHKRATIVGTRSFGKGSVQSIISLGPDGAIKLTTSRYFTPNNRSIQAAGIEPDIQVFQDIPEEFKGRDEIIGEAALDGHIDGGTKEEATTGSSVYVPSDREKDNQLIFAVALINGEETDPAFPPNPEE